MISFRFHIVSITAIFLAIAIGVVIGSTYVDDVTVDQLRNRIKTVEDRADGAREENGRLESQLQAAGEYIDLSSEYAVSERLTDVPALVAAVRGVDEDAVERTVVLARRAGGQVPGIVWLEPRWAADGDDLDALAEIVDGSDTDSREDLWAMAWDAVMDELAAEPVEDPAGGELDTGDVESGSTGPSTLAALEEAGFVSLDSVDDSAVELSDLLGAGPRVLLITGAQAEVEIAPVIPIAADASVDSQLATVVADVYALEDEAPPRAEALVDSLDDSVREALVLVDDADLEPGRVAAVLALDLATDDDELGRHYGYGEGADAVLPAWTPP